MRTALELVGGRALLNSVNLEDGDGPGTRLDAFLTLAAEHGAAVICTCIDEKGQARTAAWKLARGPRDPRPRRRELRTRTRGSLLRRPRLALVDRHGRKPAGRHRDHRGDRRHQDESSPGVHTVLGISNVSFGLAPPARHVLNSVFLHECVAAGLDAAIVHAGRIAPLHKIDHHPPRDLSRSHLRPTARGIRPPHRAHERFAGHRDDAPSPLMTAAAGRSNAASASASSTVTGSGWRRTSTRRSRRTAPSRS